MSKIFFVFSLLMNFLVFIPQAYALQGEWASSDQVRARLLSAVNKSGSDRQFAGALEVQLTPGWHTYWRSPGEAGLPPRFDWSASKNIKTVNVLWPVPERKDEIGFQVFGYKDSVTFPLEFYLDKADQDTEVELNLDIMVCNEICIPQNLKVSMLMVAAEDGKAVTAEQQSLVNFARNKVPHPGNLPQLQIKAVVAGPEALVVNAFSKTGFNYADLFAEAEGLSLTAKPQIEVSKDNREEAMITLPKPADVQNLKQALSGKVLTITVTNGREAVEKKVNF